MLTKKPRVEIGNEQNNFNRFKVVPNSVIIRKVCLEKLVCLINLSQKSKAGKTFTITFFFTFNLSIVTKQQTINEFLLNKTGLIILQTSTLLTLTRFVVKRSKPS